MIFIYQAIECVSNFRCACLLADNSHIYSVGSLFCHIIALVDRLT